MFKVFGVDGAYTVEAPVLCFHILIKDSRAAILVLLLCLAVYAVSFGVATDAGSYSLLECNQSPELCSDSEIHVGYARVIEVEEDAVRLRSWMGPVELTPWPVGTPLPSPGRIISAIGRHGGGFRVAPTDVVEHPFRGLKEGTGLVMMALWGFAGLWWLREGWRRA